MIKNYPRIITNYGSDRFEFNYEVKFNYSTYERTKYKYVKNNFTRTYSGKMQVNQANALNIAETIDEITNASIKTIYDTASHMLYQINLDDDKCVAHNLKSNKSINYFYIQDSFVNKPELYYTKSFRYSYLGEYKVDDVDCLVFEEKFNYRTSQFGGSYYYENRNATKNESTRKNKNNLTPISIMSTHYYPKESNYWSSEAEIFVPKRIEIRLFDMFRYRKSELGRLTIDFISIDSNAKEQDKYDNTKCTEVKRNS